MSSRAVIVFARNPVPGKVKTRLAAGVGDHPAARLYRGFLLDTLERFATLDCDVRLYLEPTEDPIDERIKSYDDQKLRQDGSDLGIRMARSLRETLRAGYAGVLVVGSDLPTLPRSLARLALDNIRSGRLVIGPVSDGGYGLVGLAEDVPYLFDMTFGHSGVLRETRSRADALGLEILELEPWYDVDTMDDLPRLARDLRANAAECIHTRRAMVEAGLTENTRSR